MRLWCDVFAADGATRLGAGPIQLKSATITRVLDGAGNWSIEVPGTDKRAAGLLQNKRRIRLYRGGDSGKVEITRGIIEKMTAKDDAGGWRRVVSGPDNLGELAFKSVLLGRVYDNEAFDSVITNLLNLVGGWSLSTGTTTSITARLDGVSVLKAIQTLVSRQGLHFRESGANTLEVGAFGTSNGLRLHAIPHVSREVYDNQKLLLIQQFSLAEDSDDIVNWLLPVGAGRGEAAVTLELSDRTTPYPIQTTTVNGRTLYYIQDAASQTAYGTVQRVGTFKDIAPIGTSEQNLIDAANALYDMSVAWLQRYKEKFTSYNITCRNARDNLHPGDKVRLHYKGRITDANGQTVDYRSINEDIWILEVTDNYSATGRQTRLKVATVDRYEQDAEQIILGGLETLTVNNVSVEPTFNHAPLVYDRNLDSTHPASIPINITSAIAQLKNCTVNFKSRPFSSVLGVVASGGGATATSAGGGGTTQSSTQTGLSSGLMIPVGADHRHDIAPHQHSVTIPSHTHDVTIPSHSHSMAFGGLSEDSQYPDTISISVNGVDKTTELGGPWAVGGGAADITVELADIINESTLQQRHTVEFSCDSGRGSLEITVDLWTIIQTIDQI